MRERERVAVFRHLDALPDVFHPNVNSNSHYPSIHTNKSSCLHVIIHFYCIYVFVCFTIKQTIRHYLLNFANNELSNGFDENTQSLVPLSTTEGATNFIDNDITAVCYCLKIF